MIDGLVCNPKNGLPICVCSSLSGTNSFLAPTIPSPWAALVLVLDPNLGQNGVGANHPPSPPAPCRSPCAPEVLLFTAANTVLAKQIPEAEPRYLESLAPAKGRRQMSDTRLSSFFASALFRQVMTGLCLIAGPPCNRSLAVCCSRAATRDKPARFPGNRRNYNSPDRQNPLHERTDQQVQPLITPVLPQPIPIRGRHIVKGRRCPSRHGRCGPEPASPLQPAHPPLVAKNLNQRSFTYICALRNRSLCL